MVGGKQKQDVWAQLEFGGDLVGLGYLGAR